MKQAAELTQIPFEKAKSALSRFDVKFAESELAITESHAAKIALKYGFPIVMKVDSPDIIHKTDSGCVVTNINSIHGVHDAFRKITANALKRKAKVNGITVQKQLSGKEVIIGAKRDAQFGPVIMFGMGGIMVEVMKDVAIRVAPVSKKEALEMIEETKAFQILSGARGTSRVDVDSIASLISRVSAFMVANPLVKEMDLNPCFAMEKGYAVVDVRLLV